MKQKLLKTMLLLCALIAGTSMSWADDVTVTWNISGVGTTASYQKVNTALSTSSITPSGASGTWTAVSDGNSSYAGSSTGAQLGASSNREFTGTITLSSTSIPSSALVKSVTVYAKSNGSSTLSATVGGASLGSSKTISGTTVKDYTISGSSQTGNTIVLTLSSTTASKYVNISKIVVTYEEAASVTSLSITSAPTKIRYEVGEKLDMKGFELDADGSSVTSGYTMTIGGAAIVNGGTLSSAGKKTIVVSYGGQTVNQNINVGAVQSIAITTAPAKTSYDTGDTFDPTGMVVKASLSTEEVSDPVTWTNDDVTGYTYSPTSALAPANTSVTISYAGKSTTQAITVTDVAVTGVAVKASTTIEKEKTETLTPTFTPSNATNKNVTWESDDTDVATVSAAGVVTAVAAGTANITVTTEDGGKQATCVVTVVNKKGSIDAPYSVADVIAIAPDSKDTPAESDVYVTGYIAGCCNTSTGAIIDDPTKIHDTNLALVDDPDDTSSHIVVQLSSGDNRTKYNVSDNPHRVGSTRILIKADVIKYCGIPGLKSIDEMSTVAEVVKISDASGFATYASDDPLDFTDKDIDAYIAVTKGDGTGVTFTQVNKVPANTGLLIHYSSAKTEEIPVFDGTGAETVTSNKFVKGTGATVATDGTTVWNYILNKVGGNIGFYKANGKKVAKNRAYISIPQSESASVKEFITLPDFEDDADGINTVNVEGFMVNGPIYNLSGQRVNKAQKGLYIVNGKKVLF